MRPDITLVSGTYNRLPYLRQMVQSARDAIPRGIMMDFVIVDGGSEDGTLDWLAEQPDVTTLAHGELRGAIAAFTDGAWAATGKYVLLANDDVLFKPDSIVKALVHLEDHETCGAVAFADNRKNEHVFTVDYAYAIREGKRANVPYAQVGLFRKWMGDKLNWWRGHNETFASARTYGGDNMLSSNIWELGYTVQAVDGCEVVDLIANDDLRKVNNTDGTDSELYYKSWPNGPKIKREPHVKQQDRRQLRVLYMPIYDPGYHDRTLQNKRGLRDALAKKALVYEVDYHHYTTDELSAMLAGQGGILDVFQPHMLLMQCHGLGIITPALLKTLRAKRPQMVIYNWNGDVYLSGLTSPDALSLMPYIDLQMTVNQRAVEEYARLGVNAVYWQIGYEEPGEDLPDVPEYDIVYLASAYEPKRLAFGRWLRKTYPHLRVGIYGSGWPVDVKADGECLYDFATGKALYRKAKIAIGTNEFPEQTGFVSNRIFQVLASNGAVLLQQEVVGLEELTGITSAVHYAKWQTTKDLQETIQFLLDQPNLARKYAQAGFEFVREHHSFDARVIELFRDLIPQARREPTAITALRYIGRRETPFGEKGPVTNFKYSVQPGDVLYIDPRDQDGMLKLGYFESVNVLTEMELF